MLRLYTERTAAVAAVVRETCASGLDCTTYNARGYWHGIGERSLVVETTDDNDATLRDLAKRILATGQAAVLIVALANRAEVLT